MEDEEEQGFTDSLDLVQKFRVEGVPFAVLYLPFSPQQTLISLSLSKSGQATLFGNLILAFFAQDGQADPKNDQKAYKDWLLRTIEETWNLFHKKFTALWDKHKDGSGEAYLPAIYNNPQLQQLVKQKFMSDLFHDTLGFGAAKMIRRIVGVAHVEDFESIADAEVRADCERRALDFAKMLLKERQKFQGITEVVSAIQKVH